MQQKLRMTTVFGFMGFLLENWEKKKSNSCFENLMVWCNTLLGMEDMTFIFH